MDLFFRTLADTHGPHAAAIVLSGADGDGAIGIKRIKERGGLTIAQDPRRSQHREMPSTAIATGMVDWVLPVARCRPPDGLSRPRRAAAAAARGRADARPSHRGRSARNANCARCSRFLRTRTGRDFSYYKRATILRRIARRMQVNGVTDLPAYLAFLRTHAGEAGALLQDLLISVTNFFRDADAFDALESHLPRLFNGQGPRTTRSASGCRPAPPARRPTRSPSCCANTHASCDAPPTHPDLRHRPRRRRDPRSAREGVYPDIDRGRRVGGAAASAIFTKEHRGYRVRRELRETVLFALHDLLKDSPFSRLDLISAATC